MFDGEMDMSVLDFAKNIARLTVINTCKNIYHQVCIYALYTHINT